MHIRHLEKIFSVDKVVPVDVLPVFLTDAITLLFIQGRFYGSQTFPHQSLLLSTTVHNDKIHYLALSTMVFV